MGMGEDFDLCPRTADAQGRNVATEFATQLIGTGWQTPSPAGTAE